MTYSNRAQSDLDILRDAAVDASRNAWGAARRVALAVRDWLDEVAWDQLVCTAIGHRKPLVEVLKDCPRTKRKHYEMRCSRCKRAVGTSAAKYYTPEEVRRIALEDRLRQGPR